MSTWEERMAQKAQARQPVDPERVIPLQQDPPEPGQCPLCYEWRRYPPGQEHFGFAWWRICQPGCVCAHHDNEVWLASS